MDLFHKISCDLGDIWEASQWTLKLEVGGKTAGYSRLVSISIDMEDGMIMFKLLV